MPTVTVIMSVYNGERFLAEAIESILDQTLRDLEFIVVNDSSTDSTEQIVRTFMARDDRIVLINNERNLERAESRNKGIGLARGEFVAIIDSDDVSLPEKLARQVAFLAEHDQVGFVGTAWHCIDAYGEELAPGDCMPGVGTELVHFMCNPSIMVRRDSLLQAGGYRAALVPAEDYDLWLRIADNCQAANICEPLFKYRVHAGSSTALQRSRMDVAGAWAVEMAQERKRLGRDALSQTDRLGTERLAAGIQSASAWRKRRMMSGKYATWGSAALVLKQYRKAFTSARQALGFFPANLQAWGLIAGILAGVLKAQQRGARLR